MVAEPPPEGPLMQAWSTVRERKPAPLPVAPASDRSTWGNPQALHGPSVDAIMARAQDDLGTDWPVVPASLYARYHRDGDRTLYEDYVHARHQRLTRAAVTAAVSLEPRWIDEVVDGVTALCEQSSWCWPAHDEVGDRGDHVPDMTRPYLDLGAGEVLAQLAWIDALLGEQLDAHAPGLRRRVRHEARSRAFAPFVRRRDWHWIGLDGDVHNWNPWIHGNVICGALALLDGAERDEVLALAVAGLDLYLSRLPDDGAIDEGYGYWWNGACRALEAIHLLQQCFGPLDLTALGALRASIEFPAAMNLAGPWFVSVSDSSARPHESAPWHSLHRAASEWGLTSSARFAASRVEAATAVATEDQGCGRTLLALTDTAWHRAMGSAPPAAADVWLPSIELGILRPRGHHRLTAVLKGGHNAEHHNHLDVGSCIIALDGVPVIVDPGRPTYTRETFSPRRYDIWTMQDAWHSVPAIAGIGQGQGASWRAGEARMSSTEEHGELSIDLAGAYPDCPAPWWRRTLRVDHAAGTVTLEDAWPAFAAESPTLWRVIIAGEVDHGHGRGPVRVRTLAGRTVVLDWDATLTSTWDHRVIDDPMLTRVWGDSLSRLTVRVPHAQTSASFALTIREEP
ncbi:heparinase II/III domain-containing protein [Demequina muriae]|uniref:Heparinase II/III family protein n=1 Tax=Demequina muriae TaxID=3051664 RepID=A0ABT8GEK7_9MICO|nr:heparinase II/III family protein [Demequina sp. EGI L300058]MDN4479873.1 heparinase II/III family protein [Demequina sp. EGI L300058]